MPKEIEEKSSSSNSVAQNNEEDLDEEGCCRCCHCGSGQEDVKNQNYLKMREHLQQRLKAKNNLSHSACDSSTGSRSSSSNCNIDGYAELDYLVKYIEGHKTPQRIGPNPKRAAKKARQKEKKLEQKKAEELAAKQASLKKHVPAPAPSPKVPQDRVPNGMVRITHNPLTNSAVITPLYGPLEPNPSYLQQPLGLSQPVKLAPPPNPVSIEPPRPSPVAIPKVGSNSVQPPQTSVSGLANNTSTSSQPQQMVTIRRVMQPNLSEPVVTVTLKGETPDNDRVLFTLVNGQVLPTDKSKPSSSAGNSTQGSNNTSSKAAEPASNLTPAQSVKKQKKQEKKKQKKLLLKAASNTANNTVSLPQPPQVDQRQASKVSVPLPSPQQDFTLDNFRLPPGITLTRVQGSHSPVHPELPMRMVDRAKRENSNSATNTNPPGPNPIIVTSPLSAPKPKESLGSLGGLAAPNVIVVDTRKIQQQQPTVPQQQPRPVVQTCSVGVQTGEDDCDESLPNGLVLNKQQRKKLRRREKLQEEQAVLDQLAALQLSSTSKKVNDGSKKNGSVPTNNAKVLNGQVKSAPSQVTGRGKPTNGTNGKSTTSSCTSTTTGGKTGSKKKKKSRASASAQASEDKWEENVFVPKSDLDLEGGDLDDDERELEAFKRFCFNTVPPERKEKVRIHLNVKDIFGKKSNGLHMTSCK